MGRAWPPRLWAALRTRPVCAVYWAGMGRPVDSMREEGGKNRGTEPEGADLEGRGRPPELGRDFRCPREVEGPALAVDALRPPSQRRPYPLPPRVPSYALHPVSEGALTLLRPTSRGPRPLLSTAFRNLEAHQTLFCWDIILFLRKGSGTECGVPNSTQPPPSPPTRGSGQAGQAGAQLHPAVLEVPGAPAPLLSSWNPGLFPGGPSRVTVPPTSRCLPPQQSLLWKFRLPLVTDLIATCQSICRKQSAGHLLYKPRVGKI